MAQVVEADVLEIGSLAQALPDLLQALEVVSGLAAGQDVGVARLAGQRGEQSVASVKRSARKQRSIVTILRVLRSASLGSAKLSQADDAQQLAYLASDAFGCGPLGIVMEVGVALGCAGVSVAEEGADHHKAVAARCAEGGVAVSEVVEADVFQTGCGAELGPELLEADQVAGAAGCREDPVDVGFARDLREDLFRWR